MSTTYWDRFVEINLDEAPALFTNRLHIEVKAQGIQKVVVVRTKNNGGVNA